MSEASAAPPFGGADGFPEERGSITIRFAGPSARLSVDIELGDSLPRADALRKAIETLQSFLPAEGEGLR